MRALRCQGVQRTGSRMEGGEGEVEWRVGDVRAGCLGEEAEKTGKGTSRENLALCAAPAKLQQLTANRMASLILERFVRMGTP